MVGGSWSEMQKQRDFQAEMVFSQNGGLAPVVEKCKFPREKCDDSIPFGTAFAPWI
jgi:hypothetical protein